MFDCIIVGSGVAGISAALTLKANGKSALLLGTPELSIKINSAECIKNYPGLPTVSGKEFCEALKKQLAEAEISVQNGRASGVYAMKDKFTVLTQSGEAFEGKTVILACGVESGIKIDRERELLGRGVSYCATCDGFLYKGKTIAVYATAAHFEGEIEYLASLAKKVYLFPMYKGCNVELPNVEKIMKSPVRLEGENRVNGVIYRGEKGEEELAIDGIFILKDSLAADVLVSGLKVEDGHIVVNRKAETNIAGCFAAGDCTGRPYQYAKAAGEGNVAAFSAGEYLAKNKD